MIDYFATDLFHSNATQPPVKEPPTSPTGGRVDIKLPLNQCGNSRIFIVENLFFEI